MYKQLFLIIFIALLTQCSTTAQSPASSINYHKVTFGDIKAQGRIWGIDVSYYQENIDWEKLRTQKPHFIFLKTSEGTTIQDKKYDENYKEARKLKILVGSYHFFTYLTSGKDQANNFLSVAKYKRGDLPLLLDAEFSKKMPAKKLVRNELTSFISAVYIKTGRYPMIYCDYKYYLLYLKDQLPGKIKLWIVDYVGIPNCNWTFWQTTDKFKLAGIKRNVDFNLFNGTKKQLKRILY